MHLHNMLEDLKHVTQNNYWFARITSELTYLSHLSAIKGGIWDSELEAAADKLYCLHTENGAVTKADALALEEEFSAYSAEAKKIEVICASHAHIDMNWMWGYQETASLTVDTFRTILNLMREYPDFTFSQSQASVYRIIEEHAPEMLDEIRTRVHEGRWELTASTWVETDKNMPNGESLVRHILYTKRYLSNLFGIDPDSLRVDFEPDTFGHSANVPEICQNGGVDYYYHCRGNDDGYLYNWKSKSGKSLLVARECHWYNSTVDAFYFADAPDMVGMYDFPTVLRVYGVGDHGGGPTRRDIETILDMQSWPLYPTIRFGTFHEYFRKLETIRDRLPVIDRELNFVFTGCYTTQSRIKMSNRIAEDRMYESECLSAAAGILCGMQKKNAQYETAWRKILFNHFHDILPGSGITETREYALGEFQRAMADIDTCANTAMQTLAANMDTTAIPFEDNRLTIAEGGGVGYGVENNANYLFPQTERGRGKVRAVHLFNSTMYDRHEPVRVTVWDYTGNWNRVEITDTDGNPLKWQITAGGQGYWGHMYTRLLIEADIPAFGYTTCIIKENTEADMNYTFGPTEPLVDRYGDYDVVMENDHLRAVFDAKTMLCTQMTDKRTGKVLVTKERPACALRLITENPKFGMTSWRVGPYMTTEILNCSGNVKLLETRCEPLRSTVVYEIAFASSSVRVTAVLYRGAAHIDFTFDVDWHEVGSPAVGIPQLNFHVPAAYAVEEYRYNIPFGEVARPDLAHDVPANSYMQAADGDGQGLVLVTDSKYGFRGTDNSGAVTLIRGAYDPDPYPELGKHHMRIGVGSAQNNADARRMAECYVHPVSFAAGTKHDGTLALNGSLLRLEGNAMTSAVKLAEDSGALLVRIAETAGENGTVTLHPAFPVREATLADINETPIGTCEISGDNTVLVPVSAYAMTTVLLS